MILLKIGELDVSEYVDKESYSVQRSAVYESGFKNLYGETLKQYIGCSYRISTTFTNVPDDVKRAIFSACKAAKVDITFPDSGDKTAAFDMPELTAALQYETADGVMMWTISFSALCELDRYGL